MPEASDSRRVESAGVWLSVRERSRPAAGKASVVLVHGYPDQQDLWDPVVDHLDPDRLHIVTYDVRGAGDSDVPASTDGYRTELLVEDLAAAVEATVPDHQPFHLVGHDWGSTQLWDALARSPRDARLRGRIASFTSISGPSLDHVAYLTRHRRGRRLRMLAQGVRSSYVFVFGVPVVGEAVGAVSAVLGALAAGRSRTGTTSRSHWVPWGPRSPGMARTVRNARHGVGLYRANVRRRLRNPGRLRTQVPVLVVHPARDPFLTATLLEDLDMACENLTVVWLDAGHWVPRTHPEEVARLVTEHVAGRAVAATPPRRSRPRSPAPRPRSRWWWLPG